MSYSEVFNCDICGVMRGPSNHWILAWRDIAYGRIHFSPWDRQLAEDSAFIHLCGETCAATHLTRYISKTREEAAV